MVLHRQTSRRCTRIWSHRQLCVRSLRDIYPTSHLRPTYANAYYHLPSTDQTVSYLRRHHRRLTLPPLARCERSRQTALQRFSVPLAPHLQHQLLHSVLVDVSRAYPTFYKHLLRPYSNLIILHPSSSHLSQISLYSYRHTQRRQTAQAGTSATSNRRSGTAASVDGFSFRSVEGRRLGRFSSGIPIAT